MARCDENARKGTGYGVCDAPLDGYGQCSNAGHHVPTDEVPGRDPDATPEPASIDADTVADIIRAERTVWHRCSSPDNPALATAMETLDSLTVRLATTIPTGLQVDFFRRCGHTGVGYRAERRRDK